MPKDTHPAFVTKGATEELEPIAAAKDAPKEAESFAAHHTFDGFHQLRRVTLTPEQIKQGDSPIYAFCRRLTRLFPEPAVATWKEEAVSKDARQHLYRVTVVSKRPKKHGRPVLGEGWLRVVLDERQTRRH
jgi:hypothetical protein